jgi:putative ABC transport system substrate-binding protein
VKRREFISLLGGAAAAWPLAARAQQGERVRRIGILASQPLPPFQRFAGKLGEYGYIEGRNLQLVSRFVEGRDDRYLAMATELAALPVDVIVTWGTPAALAAKQATKTIPVVMGAVGEPVSVGIVSNLARRPKSEEASRIVLTWKLHIDPKRSLRRTDRAMAAWYDPSIA